MLIDCTILCINTAIVYDQSLAISESPRTRRRNLGRFHMTYCVDSISLVFIVVSCYLVGDNKTGAANPDVCRAEVVPWVGRTIV